ncbi:MAG: DUF2470 domain-containing protein [Pseudomonadota bacterium]
MGESEGKKDVLRETDDDARRQGKALIRTARFGALACLEPGSGAPLASRVGLAATIDGAPLFLISELSSHFGALEADARASLLIGEPGRGDPLAHPRITVIGRAERISDADAREVAKARYLGRHPKAALYADFADFAFWRLRPERASLNGGFGKAYAMSAEDLATPCPTGLEAGEPGATAHMNDDHLDAVADYATAFLKAEPGAWRLASIDAEGLDLMLGERIERLWFDAPLQSAGALRAKLVDMAKVARAG